MSDAITVSGINRAVPIMVTGGKYSVNGGRYTPALGLVSNGDTVRVQVRSAGQPLTERSATLTISRAAAAFRVTTARRSR